LKIDLIHYSAPPVVGGVESVIAHHAKLMAGAGHAVRILAGRGESFDARIPILHLPLLDSRHPEILATKQDLDRGRVPEQFEKLRAQLLSEIKGMTSETDILFAHNVCSLNKNLPLTAALYELYQSNASLHMILWHHDLAWTTPRYRLELHPGYPWDLLRCDWPGTTQVVVSALRQQEITGLFGVPAERVVVVPNGVDLPGFLKLESQTVALISRLDLLNAEPLLLLPVRITPRKNIELALRTLAALQTSYPLARLVVSGPLGPHNPTNVHYFNELCTLREELGLIGSVFFLAEISPDYLPDAVIADFFHLSDALILPSREEGFGIPILEAGLAGLPIFCADIPPLRELAGEYGVYFDPDAEPEAVAVEIEDVFSSSPVYPMRVKVRTQYTWGRVYSEHIAPLLAPWRKLG